MTKQAELETQLKALQHSLTECNTARRAERQQLARAQEALRDIQQTADGFLRATRNGEEWRYVMHRLSEKAEHGLSDG